MTAPSNHSKLTAISVGIPIDALETKRAFVQQLGESGLCLETKRALVSRLVRQLRPGGWFIISHSESLHGVTDELKMLRPSIYQRPLV